MKKSEAEEMKKAAVARRLWIAVTVVVCLFTGYVMVRNLIVTIDYRLRIRSLERDRERYEQSIASDSLLMEQLSDDDFLEKYARERYKMQRADEDVYIVK